MKRIVSYITPIIFILALWVLHHELRSYHYHDIVRELHQIPLNRILLSFVLAMAGYAALTGYDFWAFRYIKYPALYWQIAPVSFISYSLGHNFGNTLITGGSIRFRMYSLLGLGAMDITRIILFCGMTFWIGFLGLSGVSFLFDPPSNFPLIHLSSASLRCLGVLFISIVIVYVCFGMIKKTPFTFRGYEFYWPTWKIALGQIGVGCLDVLSASSALYILLPMSDAVSYPQFLGVYLVGLVSGLISQVPGGVGVFETMIMILLGPQVDRSQLLGCLLVFRGIYYLFPLIVGALCLGFLDFKEHKSSFQNLARSLAQRIPVLTPNVISLTTFVGGTILLFSGAMPVIHGRLGWLNRFFPLPVLELSHFLGSIVGAALLILARGLQRRVDAAYYLTAVLLGFGIFFSLLRGFDYGGAIILAIMLAVLLPSHQQFYRRASLFREPFTPGWIMTILLVLITVIWIGLFSYKHVSYSHELWWQFSLRGDAPRFLRASAGAMGFLLIFSIAKLLRPSLAASPSLENGAMDRITPIVLSSPRASANLAFLGDKSFLFNSAGTCFLMYGVEKRSWVVLGDPVGPVDEWTELIWTYHEWVSRQGGWTVFYQIESESIHFYLDLGLTLIKIGEEARVPLENFSLEGSSRRRLRHTYHKIKKGASEFVVLPPKDFSSIYSELHSISGQWLAEKNTQEKRFSLGSFQENYLCRFPCALVKVDGQIAAFANILATGQKQEITVDLIRFSPDAPRDVMEYLFIELMLWSRQQGYRWFNLGMAPLSGLENRPLAPMWSRIGGMIYHHGEHFYHFEGLREFKNKFDPVWSPKYLATPGGLALPKVVMDIASLIGGGMKGVFTK